MNKVYSIDGELKLSFIDLIDGSERKMMEFSDENGRIQMSWWSRFDTCIGHVVSPFPNSNVGNVIFGLVSNAATMGLYLPASGIVCAGVATAQGYEAKLRVVDPLNLRLTPDQLLNILVP